MATKNSYVLLKNFSKNGLVKFHGITSNFDVASAWQNSGISNWFYEFDGNTVVAQNPITFEKMNNGEIE